MRVYHLTSAMSLTFLDEDAKDLIFYNEDLKCKDRAELCQIHADWKSKCYEPKHVLRCNEEKVRPIRDYVDDQNPLVRAAAILALGALGELAVDHVDAVAKMLNSSQDVVREAAMRALGAFGELAVDHVGAVAEKLGPGNDVSERIAAMEALAAFGEVARPYVDVIKGIFVDSNKQPWGITKPGLLALGALGELTKERVDTIAEGLGSFRADLACEQMSVFGAFGELVKREHIKTIVQIMSGGRSNAGAAVKALGAFATIVQEEDVDVVVNTLKNTTNTELKKDAMNTLSAFGELARNHEEALEEIKKNIQDRDHRVQLTALQAFGKLTKDDDPSPSVLTTIFDLAANASRHIARRDNLFTVGEALRALGNFRKVPEGYEKPWDFVAEQLKNGDSYIREAATEVLGKFGKLAKEHVDKVAERLDDPSYSVRLAAIKALGNFGEHSLRHWRKVVAKLGQEQHNVWVYAREREKLGFAVGYALKKMLTFR